MRHCLNLITRLSFNSLITKLRQNLKRKHLVSPVYLNRAQKKLMYTDEFFYYRSCHVQLVREKKAKNVAATRYRATRIFEEKTAHN